MSNKGKGPAIQKNAAGENKRPLLVSLHYYRGFYVMFLPVLIFAVVFNYLPMLGIRYAFCTYKGIKAPEFIGLGNFEKMISMPGFWTAFGNTLVISIVKLLLNTFMAVLLSLLLNELRSMKFKKFAQTVVYLPHFMSWVVTASVFTLILSPTNAGLVNSILIKLGIIDEGIYFLGSQDWWRPMYYMVNVWKDTGWGTIIFMATLSGISPELYEAASMDGAGRWNCMRYITLPALANTIITVLILNLAKIMNLFESVFVMQNDAVIKQSDVLQTYINTQEFNSGSLTYKVYTPTSGFASSIVGCILVLVCNKASFKVRGRGIV